MSWKKLLLNKWAAFVAVALLAFGAGYYTRPVKKEVTKTVTTETDQKTTKNDIITVVKNPDGTTTTVTDHSTITETHKDTSTTQKVVTTAPQKNYSLGIAVDFPYDDLKTNTLNKYYRAEVGRRLVEDFWGAVSYSTHDNSLGLGVRYEF